MRSGPRLRPALVALHRYAGLAMAGFLVLSGLTGSIIAFHKELDAWLNPSLFRVSPRLASDWSASAVVAVVERADPQVRVSFVSLSAAADRTVEVFVVPRGEAVPDYDQVFVDPATGTIVGRRHYGDCCFAPEKLIPFLYQLHYTLHLPELWGVWLMGGIALVWFVDCFVGFYLTLPRGRSIPLRAYWSKWRPAWAVKWRAGGYRINLDLHRAGGLWLWGALLLMAMSSISLNLHDEVFEPVVSSLAAVTPDILETRSAISDPAARRPGLDFDAALRTARSEATGKGWPHPPESMFHSQEAGLYGINFGDEDEATLGLRVVYVDDRTGQVVGNHVPGGGTFGDLLHDVQFPLHSGRIAGLPGRIFISAMGLLVAMLSITGIVIWMRKRTAQRWSASRTRTVPKAGG